jgi:hypothetical protein
MPGRKMPEMGDKIGFSKYHLKILNFSFCQNFRMKLLGKNRQEKDGKTSKDREQKRISCLSIMLVIDQKSL